MGKSTMPVSVMSGIPKLGKTPSGWKTVKFGDLLIERQRPLKLEDDREYQLVVAKRSRGGVVPREKLLGKQILTKTQFEIKANDFLISNRQIVHGACGIVPKSLDGSVVSNEYTILHPNADLDLRYLNFLTYSTYFQQTCFHASVGVDIEKMIFSIRKWLEYRVPIPPIEKQEYIVDILTSWTNQILNCKMLIEKYTKYEKGLMKSLFNTGEEISLGEICRPRQWKTIGSKELLNNGYPVYGANGLIGYYSEYTHSERTVAITCRGATCGTVNLIPAMSYITGNSMALDELNHKKILTDYLFHVLRHRGLNDVITGSAQPQIVGNALVKIKIPIPSLKEQKKISELLSSILGHISHLEKYEKVLDVQFKGLLRTMVSGQLDVGKR